MLLFIDPDEARQQRDKIDRLIEQADERLQIQVILNNGLPELHNFQTNTLVDYRGDLETRLGTKTNRAILIRPDGYVASDLETIDPDAFVKQLATWKTEKIAVAKELVTQ